jgi:hypothetical protein
MDDVLLPRRSLIAHGTLRNPNVVSLILVLLMFSFSIAGLESSGTLSFFTDAAQSTDNFFVADPIFFSVTAPTTDHTFVGAEATGTPIVLTTVPGEGSDPIQYYVSVENVSGSAVLCSALTATGDTPLAFSGPLVALHTGTTTAMGPWNLSVSLPNATGIADGDTCSVTLVYKGWNDGVLEGGGYSDTHKVPLTFSFKDAAVTQIVPLTTSAALDQSGGGGGTFVPTAPAESTTTDATSTDTVVTDPTLTAPEATTTEAIVPPVPADVTPPVDVPPPSGETVVAPTDTPPPVDSTPPADTSTTDTPPPDPTV